MCRVSNRAHRAKLASFEKPTIWSSSLEPGCANGIFENFSISHVEITKLQKRTTVIHMENTEPLVTIESLMNDLLGRVNLGERLVGIWGV
jgi:hypothetical protein